jgi:hypothetical protein
MLETLLAAMPLTQQKLQREQSIDFGTVIESLKSMFKERERVRLATTHNAEEADLLMKTWEAIFYGNTKVLVSDRVLLSASRQATVELVKAVQIMGRKIESLPQIFLSEFNESKYSYTLANMASGEFLPERL